ncbi:MAG: FxLYD domain-containing protein [Halohasta sp.]
MSDPRPRDDRPTRRRLLGAVGTALTLGAAGCLGGDPSPRYERRDVEAPADAEARSPAELSAAAAVATTETNPEVAPIDTVDLVSHEFVYESGYRGSTVQGTIENTGPSRLDLGEVRVRVYDTEDRLRGQYVDTVGDLDAGDEWRFVVILLESPSAIGSYGIAALGMPT